MEIREALKKRIGLATQKDVMHGMFIENSLVLVAKLKSQAFADDLRDKILGGKKMVSFFRYPAADLLKIMDATVEGAADPQALLEEFGSNSVRIFFDSPVGRTMLMLASSNPHKLFFSAPAGFRASSSFGERTYKKETDHSGVMETTGDLLGPLWTTGVFKYALEAACNLKVKVHVDQLDDAGLDYNAKVSWE